MNANSPAMSVILIRAPPIRAVHAHEISASVIIDFGNPAGKEPLFTDCRPTTETSIVKNCSW